ncbi:efflux RND transporter permease subunit [Klebsiella pneumoniae]|nr:efflux RND transporter permease subunit [Klebsiella pneumoniae]UDD13037.1 efflux RND transporter permease subunit [Klebsiella pneumoniae]
MSKFFIHRPVFAWVLAIIMMIAGGLAILQLPIAQYPTIAPPAVAISATYPGADAQTVQDTVTQVIEQNMNGIDNLMYMSSTSDSAGSVTITLTFKSGTVWGGDRLCMDGSSPRKQREALRDKA